MKLEKAIHREGDLGFSLFVKKASQSTLEDPPDRSKQLAQFVPRLKRIRNLTDIIYSSAIAYQLAAELDLPALTIANQMAEQVLNATYFSMEDWGISSVSQETAWLEVRVLSSGLMQWVVREPMIAGWLNHLLHHSLQRPPVIQVSPPPFDCGTDRSLAQRAFALQHAHARCCSLLRLAHRQNQIVLSSGSPDPRQWHITEPATVPWLTPHHQLTLNHPTERNLISQLVTTLDDLAQFASPPSVKAVFQRAETLSHAFDRFHCHHPICGDAGPLATPIAAQMGLVRVTQRVLYLLLEDLLGLCAPVEL